MLFRKIVLTVFMSAVGCGLFAQTKEVRGIVLDADESTPLVAASVGALAAGSKTEVVKSTITDLDGRFRMDVPVGTQELLVVYVGYERQIVACGTELVKVLLSPESLDIADVIVTGYGKIDRRKSTASVSSINLTDVSQASMGIDQMLKGTMAGVNVTTVSGTPGAPAKIRIRGTSSLQGTQDPLWVVDGMPLEGTDLPKLENLSGIDELYSSAIAGINPQDIASVSVLRDAAATAIYGARAANGVIVVNTKSGKKGRIHVNYSGKLSVVARPDVARLGLLTSSEKVGLELDLLRSSYTTFEKKGGVSRILQAYGELNTYKSGGFSSLSSAAQEEINALRDISTDWNRELFRSALSHDHFLSVSGGADWADYYVSAGYFNEAGAVRGVNASRINLTSKTRFHFGERVDIGVSLLANQRKNNSFLSNTDGYTNPVFYSRAVNPYLRIYDASGNYVYDPDMRGFGRDDDVIRYNIVEERSNTRYDLTNLAFTAVFDLSWRIWRGLTLESQAGVQYDERKLVASALGESYAVRRELQRSRLSDGSSYIPKGGFYRNTDGHSFQYTVKNMLRYVETFKAMHSLDVMIGNELRRASDESIFSAGYGYDADALTTKMVRFTREDQGRYTPLFKRNYAENAFVSFFGTVSYTLLSRYTLGGSVRFDGSNLFGVDPKYRYLPLYSVSAMWDVKQESFLENVNWLSDLRLRASYGLQGNVDKNTYSTLVGVLRHDAFFYPQQGGGEREGEDNITIESPPNSRLRWEKTRTYNIGLDVSFASYRVKLALDYYDRLSSDLIGMRKLPLESGFAYTTVNWSRLTNRGVDVNASVLVLKVEGFEWNIQSNFSYNYNRIDRLTTQDNSRRPSGEGYPVGGIFVLPYVGIDQYGYPLLRGARGESLLISELLRLRRVGPSNVSRLSPAEERALFVYAGTEEPPYSMGVTTSFSWGGIELSLSAVGNFGHKFLVQPYYSFTQYDRGLNTTKQIFSRWTDDNPSGTLPRLMTEKDLGRASEYTAYDEGYQKLLSLYVRDASYVRLQSVRLSYAFPSELLKRVKISSASVAVEGRNLLVWGKDYDGFIDPETMKNPYAQPIPKSVSLSLTLGF